MKKAIVLALMGVSAVVCLAQSSRFPPINLYTGDPTGNACTGNIIQQSSTNGLLYSCQSGAMKVVSGSTGSGTVSGQSSGTIPLATGATTIGSQSHLDDGVTTSGAITSTEPINGPSAKFTGTVATTAALTSTLPTLDIRNPAFAGGAVCDGATNSGPAIQAAINALPVGGAIMLPANCFWDNSTQPTWSSVSGPITLVVVGTLNTKTSIVIPNNQFINVVGQGGGSNTTSFASPSQIANISVSGSPKGVLGTAITVTPNGSTGNDFGVVASFTPSTMTGLYVGTGITIAGTSTCTISTITRVSGTVTATLSAACHIPPGVIVSVAGVTDSGFNGTHTGGASAGPFDVVDSDYVANTVSWRQAAADASSTGGTITGFNEDSYENVQITAVTSTTATAKFYRSHTATERWGVVGLIVNGNTKSSVIQNLQITSPGTQLWIPQSYETRIINVSGSNTGGCNSDPTLSTFNPGIDVGASTWIHFEHIGFTSFCEPWSLHMSQTYNFGFADAGPIYVDDSFLLRGIKMDHGGFGVYWDKSVCDQCARAIVTYDPTNYWNGNGQVITIDKTFLQDNPDGFLTYLVYQLTPIGGGSSASALARIGTIGGYGLAGTVNTYFTGTTGNPTDLELSGEQAGLAPAVLPYATVDVVQSPAGWATASPGNDFCTTTSTTALAPDGTSTAGTLAVNTGAFDIIGQSSITPAIGDRVLFGGWESGAPQNGGVFVDNNSSSHYSLNWTASGYSKVTVGQWDLAAGYWHPNVGLATVTASDGTAGQGLRLGLSCSAAGATYWMPFIIYIPASANIPAAEVHRWRRQLLHGVVPANMPAGVLAINPAHKLYWGNDTNLYRGSAGVVQTDGTLKAPTIVAGNTYLAGWTSPAAYGASTSNTAAQNQTAFLAMATAINAGTTSPHIFLAGDGTYNVLSTGGTALGTYNVPIDFECASWNTTINLSGTGKLIQMGASGWNGYPGGTSPIAWQLNRFHGCQLTGGASASDGIYIATGNTGAWVEHNYFYNFMGASSNGSPSGQKVEAIDSYGVTETHIENNQYMRTDGVFGNFAWAHGSTYYYSLFASNNRMICSVSTINGNSVECGAGIESNGILYAFGNECSGPNPCFNVGTELGSSGTSVISGSLLEAVNGCEVDYGTPGGLSTETVNNLVVTNNQVGLFGTSLGFVCARNAFVKLANSDISHNHRRNDATSTLPAVFMNNLTGQTGNQGLGNTGFPSLHSTGANISAWNVNGIAFGAGLTVVDTGNGPSVSAPVGASFVTAPNPVFSPAGGTYGSPQTVTITCATGSPYYSTDGSTVTAYTAGISISALTTLQGSCQGGGYFPSGTSAIYNFGTLASDSFPGTTLSANWTASIGTFAVASANFRGATSGLDVAYYNAVSWPNDQFSQVTIGSATSGNDVGAVVRWQSGAASGYAVDVTSGNVYLRKYTAGSSVVLAGPTAHTLAGGDVFKIDVQGTTLAVYLNGTAVSGMSSVTDATYSSGNAGIFYFLTGGATPTAGAWSGGTP